MDFNSLYLKLKEDFEMYSQIKNEGILFCKKKGFDIFNTPSIAVQANNICFNACSFCTNPANGEYLDLNKVSSYIKDSKIIQLTGGEPFLQPEKNLEDFLSNYSQNNDSYLVIMASGINPNAPKEMIDRYYSNFEKVAKSSNVNRKVLFVFSYSQGINLDKRLVNFFEYYKTLFRKNNVYLEFKILVNNESEVDSKTAELKGLINYISPHYE
ncbi:MAG: hypothetical protein PHN56_02220, partial [Candidatus Nanoarchaeia archaeon]|nr:hypothetical protein [Candidatus Nanoarchaeia archaeon]